MNHLTLNNLNYSIKQEGDLTILKIEWPNKYYREYRFNDQSITLATPILVYRSPFPNELRLTASSEIRRHPFFESLERYFDEFLEP